MDNFPLPAFRPLLPPFMFLLYDDSGLRPTTSSSVGNIRPNPGSEQFVGFFVLLHEDDGVGGHGVELEGGDLEKNLYFVQKYLRNIFYIF